MNGHASARLAVQHGISIWACAFRLACVLLAATTTSSGADKLDATSRMEIREEITDAVDSTPGSWYAVSKARAFLRLELSADRQEVTARTLESPRVNTLVRCGPRSVIAIGDQSAVIATSGGIGDLTLRTVPLDLKFRPFLACVVDESVPSLIVLGSGRAKDDEGTHAATITLGQQATAGPVTSYPFSTYQVAFFEGKLLLADLDGQVWCTDPPGGESRERQKVSVSPQSVASICIHRKSCAFLTGDQPFRVGEIDVDHFTPVTRLGPRTMYGVGLFPSANPDSFYLLSADDVTGYSVLEWNVRGDEEAASDRWPIRALGPLKGDVIHVSVVDETRMAAFQVHEGRTIVHLVAPPTASGKKLP